MMVGLVGRKPKKADAAYWMRVYFRHARSVERRVSQAMDEVPVGKAASKLLGGKRERKAEVRQQGVRAGFRVGFQIERGRVVLEAVGEFGHEPAQDPDVVLEVFETMAQTGARLGRDAEERLSEGLPLPSAHLGAGPALWHHPPRLMTGFFPGNPLPAIPPFARLHLSI